MWKRIAVVGSSACGVRHQIRDRIDGRLVGGDDHAGGLVVPPRTLGGVTVVFRNAAHRYRLQGRIWVLWSLYLLVGLACSRQPQSVPPRHVFLITVDTLRADHMSLYGYDRRTTPFLDELAQQGVVFEQAIAQWPKTGPSMASLFTGMYPKTTGMRHRAALRLVQSYLTLPEFFKEQGFKTLAVVSNPVLSARLDWHHGFDEYVETWKGAPPEAKSGVKFRPWISAVRVNRLALPLLRRYANAERLFVWIHYSDPHGPYVLPEGFGNPFIGDPLYVEAGSVMRQRRRRDRAGANDEVRFEVAQYDANILVTDLHMKELFDHAKSLGLMEATCVVIAADHGQSLGEHGYFGHGSKPYSPTTRVPLLVWWPQAIARGHRIGEAVELIDLFPTLSEVIASESVSQGLEGDSLHSLLAGIGVPGSAPAPSYAYTDAGTVGNRTRYRAVQDAQWKLVYLRARRAKRGRRLPERFELFHLAQDPLETIDVKQRHPSEFERLKAKLSEWIVDSENIRHPPQETEKYDRETLENLRAMGYVD